MCFCSVILRGILATVISHVEGSRDKSFASCKWHLQTTSRIIDFMTKVCVLVPSCHHPAIHLIDNWFIFCFRAKWSLIHSITPLSCCLISLLMKSIFCCSIYGNMSRWLITFAYIHWSYICHFPLIAVYLEILLLPQENPPVPITRLKVDIGESNQLKCTVAECFLRHSQPFHWKSLQYSRKSFQFSWWLLHSPVSRNIL